MIYSCAHPYYIHSLTHTRVIGDMDEEVFSMLFSDDWQKGPSIPHIDSLTVSIDDYLTDIEKWLPPYYYTKFMRELFLLTVFSYCMAIRRHADGSFCWTTEHNCVARVADDHDRLVEYFSQHEETLQRGGLKPKSPDSSVVRINLFLPIFVILIYFCKILPFF